MQPVDMLLRHASKLNETHLESIDEFLMNEDFSMSLFSQISTLNEAESSLVRPLAYLKGGMGAM